MEVPHTMITLYHSPLLRSVRVYWLLEELGLPYRLEQVLAGKPYLLGAEFTAPDIMMGVTLLGAKWRAPHRCTPQRACVH
jgi:glutathione S-transferase